MGSKGRKDTFKNRGESNFFRIWIEPTPCGNGSRSEVRRCSGVDSTRVVGGHDDHDGDGSGSIGGGHSIDHCRYRSSIDRDGDGSSCFDHPAGRTPRPAMALARGRDPRH